MKGVLLPLLLLPAVASGARVSPAGLYGVVLIDPARPVCRVGEPCTAPAKRVALAFSRAGRTVRARTDDHGAFRIALRPGTYSVTVPGSKLGAGLEPKKVAVPRSGYRRLTFKLDVGIR